VIKIFFTGIVISAKVMNYEFLLVLLLLNP